MLTAGAPIDILSLDNSLLRDPSHHPGLGHPVAAPISVLHTESNDTSRSLIRSGGMVGASNGENPTHNVTAQNLAVSASKDAVHSTHEKSSQQALGTGTSWCSSSGGDALAPSASMVGNVNTTPSARGAPSASVVGNVNTTSSARAPSHNTSTMNTSAILAQAAATLKQLNLVLRITGELPRCANGTASTPSPPGKCCSTGSPQLYLNFDCVKTADVTRKIVIF